MCKKLNFKDTPEVEIIRLRRTQEKYERPIKVSFKLLWEKRKLLSSLYKLKSDENFKNISVQHDMTQDERRENKRLLKIAYDQNQSDKSTGYRWKVRGPPWGMKITKVFAKN